MKPVKRVCEKCGDEVYGLSEKDVSYKLAVHNLKHRIKIKEDKK
jgi:hypothetical protein